MKKHVRWVVFYEDFPCYRIAARTRQDAVSECWAYNKTEMDISEWWDWMRGLGYTVRKVYIFDAKEHDDANR